MNRTWTQITLILLFLSLISTPAFSVEKNKIKSLNGPIRLEMNQLLQALSELNSLKIDERMFENDLNTGQVDVILKTVKNIRTLDSQKNFKKDLDALEKLTQQLQIALKNKDPKARIINQQIFETCLKCHQTHDVQSQN